MIEEPPFLVVIEEKHRFAEYVWIGYQNVNELRDVPGAEVRGPVGVFRVGFRSYDIGYLRQFAGSNVLAEHVEEPGRIHVIGKNICPGLRFIGQRAARWRVLVLMEVQQRIIPVIAHVRPVAGPTPKPFRS